MDKPFYFITLCRFMNYIFFTGNLDLKSRIKVKKWVLQFEIKKLVQYLICRHFKNRKYIRKTDIIPSQTLPLESAYDNLMMK